MDDKNPDQPRRLPSLTAAIRVARVEEAERSHALGELRGAEIARLDLLRESIAPVLSQVPAEVDMFDVGLSPGEHPRLFIDMISFIEMGRDRRTYRFLQDTRNGRVLLAESDALTPMTDAVTRYIARRLVEREQTLASLGDDGIVPRPLTDIDAPVLPAGPAAAPGPAPAGFTARVARLVRIGVDGLGILLLAGLVWFGVQYFHNRFPTW